MAEENKVKTPSNIYQRRIFITLGWYSLGAALLSLFWSGSLLNLFFILAALGIFLYSLFSPLVGFFILLTFRTAFDYLGNETELFNLFGISINFTFLLGIILIVLTGIELIRKRAKFFKVPLFYPWLLFLLINIILSFFSFDKFASLINFFRLFSFFSAFIFGYLVFDNAKKLTNLAKMIIFSAIIPAAVAWGQFFNGTGFYDGARWRLDGTFTHPNMLALYLVLVICLTLFVALNLRKGAIVRIPYIFLSIFFVIPLIFTYTRVAWLALAFILFIIGVYRFRKLLLISVVAVLLAYLFMPSFQDRISTLASVGAADSSSWRLDLWSDMIVYIKANPWFGYGPGTASVFLEKNIPRLLTETEPHNDYLRIWLESGIFALLSYLWIFIDYLKRLRRGFKQETRPRLKMLILFLGLFTIAILGASLTDNILKDSVMQWEFWSLSGGIFAVTKILPKKKESL